MIKKTINKLNQVKPRRGGKLLLELLESEGVEYVFGNPGTTELPFIDALIDSPTVKYIWGLQEASVVAMADGYAQASGRPGFINLHTAGGLGHGLWGTGLVIFSMPVFLEPRWWSPPGNRIHDIL